MISKNLSHKVLFEKILELLTLVRRRRRKKKESGRKQKDTTSRDQVKI